MTTATTPHPAVAARSAALGRRLWPGLLLVIYGAVQLDGALITAAYRGSSPVPDDRLSYPWDGAAAVTTSVLWGGSQVLFVIGLVAFARSSAVVGRSGRRGAWVAVAGAALYVVAHATSVLFRDADLDDGGALVALTCFGIGTVLTAVGMIVAGIDVASGGRWSGWRRRVPLAFGAWLLVMLPLQFTPALPLAVAMYASITVALGVASIEETVWERQDR